MQNVTKLDRPNGLFYAALCAALILSAIYLNTYGPDAPLTMDAYGIDSAAQGLIMSLQSVGGTVAAIFLGLRGEAFSKIRMVGLGILVLAAGTIVMGIAPSYGVLLCLAMLSGVGFSFIDVMVNGAISDMYPQRKNALLAIAHALYGAGAMVAPVLVAGLVRPQDARTWIVPFITVGIACAVLFLFYLRIAAKVAPTSPYAHMDRMRTNAKQASTAVFKSRTAWILLLAGVLYFSFQMGASAWLPSHCLSVGISFDQSSLMVTAFFGGSLVMGFLTAFLVERLTARRMFGLFGILSAVCMMVALLITEPSVMAVLVVASGFFQGCGVVTLIIVLTDAFPGHSASAASIQVVSANIGAITAPVWIGAVADSVGYAPPLLVSCGMYVAGSVLVLLFAPKKKR